MKQITTALILMISLALSAQKEKTDLDYDKKTGIVTVNAVPVFKVDEEKSSTEPGGKDYTIKSLDGKNLILLVIHSYKDWHEVSKYNPDGRVIYYSVRFFDDKKSKCEISYDLFKKIMKKIHNADLIKDGKLDDSAIEIFVMKNGTKFSDLEDRR